MYQPRTDLVPLEEISVGRIEAEANAFAGFDPEGAICRKAAELARNIVDAQNRMTTESGGEYMRAAYEGYALGRQYKLLTRFAREASNAMQDLTSADAIDKTVIVLNAEINQSCDEQEKREKRKALEAVEQLFRADYVEPTTDALPDPSAE